MTNPLFKQVLSKEIKILPNPANPDGEFQSHCMKVHLEGKNLAGFLMSAPEHKPYVAFFPENEPTSGHAVAYGNMVATKSSGPRFVMSFPDQEKKHIWFSHTEALNGAFMERLGVDMQKLKENIQTRIDRVDTASPEAKQIMQSSAVVENFTKDASNDMIARAALAVFPVQIDLLIRQERLAGMDPGKRAQFESPYVFGLLRESAARVQQAKNPRPS